MTWVICPVCADSFHLSPYNFNDDAQCSKCGEIIRVVIKNDIVQSAQKSGLTGNNIEGMPEDISACYEEAMRCMGSGCFTASELLCRKILMHIAVEKGASEGKSFAYYINYLEEEGYVARHMKKWVDLIRKHGNESTHSLNVVEKNRADSTLSFTAQLLVLLYEMPLKAEQYIE